jgi:hypothetical protein
MNSELEFLSNFTTPNATIIQEDLKFRVFDGLLAIGLCACLVIGFPGNCVALVYFLRAKQRKTLSSLLYLVACFIDMCSSVFHVPVIVSFLTKRKPGAFKNDGFCSFWYLLLLQLQPMSMLVVMFQCISRSVVVLFPFQKVSKRIVIGSFTVCLVLNIAWTTTFIMISDGFYSRGAGYCIRYVNIEEGGNLAVIVKETFHTYYCLIVGVPQIAVFFVVLASVFKLRRSDTRSTDEASKHKASITISYFAAIFLMCNSVTFVNMILYTKTISDTTLDKDKFGSYPGKIFRNTFMFFYSWPISEVLCTVLNAALNPLLYLLRMNEMRLWVKQKFVSKNVVLPSFDGNDTCHHTGEPVIHSSL